MYSRDKYYLNAEQYVQDLSDFKDDKDSGNMILWTLAVIIAVELILKKAMEAVFESTDSIVLILLMFIGVPAGLIVLGVKLYKDYKRNFEARKKGYQTALRVIKSVPEPGDFRMLDDFVVKMIMAGKIKEEKLAELKKLRENCFDPGSGQPFREPTTVYMDVINEMREKCGLKPYSADFLKTLKEEPRKKEESSPALSSSTGSDVMHVYEDSVEELYDFDDFDEEFDDEAVDGEDEDPYEYDFDRDNFEYDRGIFDYDSDGREDW